MITPAQCRAARAWLNLTQADLGSLIRRDRSTIKKFETGRDVQLVLILAIQHVLEERGIRFETCGTGGPKPYLGICGPQ
jgi:DNA-binding XRE family transcriptional regulator